MLSVNSLSLKQISFPFDNKNVFSSKKKAQPFYFSSSSSVSGFVCWAEKDSQQFEVDPDKAREALKQLDQQIQSISQKQVRSPKIKASDVNLTRRDQATTEEVSEFSTSFLAYMAGALFLFTIFYNVLFVSVIKPAIDGPDEAPIAAVERQIAK